MSRSGASPSIRISYQSDRVVYINKPTFQQLSNPPYISLLYVEGKKLLVIEGHAEKVKDSIAIPKKYYDTPDKKEFKICRKLLTDAFRVRLGWDEGVSYRINGKLSAELGVVVFNLARAAVIRADTNN